MELLAALAHGYIYIYIYRDYCIAGNFGGQNIRGSAILRHFMGNIFVVGACTAGKGKQGRFICG